MRRRAFTLVEMLMVMGIISMLASLLFPVFAQTRKAAKGASCMGNLRQIGLGTDLYTNDNDGFYPLGVDSEERFLMGWEPDEDQADEVYGLLPTVPLMRDVLAPYVGGQGIWRCPSDVYSQEQVVRFANRSKRLFDLAPNAFAALGTSYAYKVSLGFDHVQSPAACVFSGPPDTDYGPTESIVFWDFTFKSHEIKISEDILFDPASLQQNALFADGHTQHINGRQFTRGTFCRGR